MGTSSGTCMLPEELLTHSKPPAVNLYCADVFQLWTPGVDFAISIPEDSGDGAAEEEYVALAASSASGCPHQKVAAEARASTESPSEMRALTAAVSRLSCFAERCVVETALNTGVDGARVL